jgi:hypothetical protein
LELTLFKNSIHGNWSKIRDRVLNVSFKMALLRRQTESQGRQPFYLWKKRAGQFEFPEY